MASSVGLHADVRVERPAGHEARAVPRAFFAAGDAHAHEVQPGLFQLGLPPCGVGVVRVAAVDEEVPAGEVRPERRDDGVDGLPGRHHHEDGAGRGERLQKRVEAGGGEDGADLPASS